MGRYNTLRAWAQFLIILGVFSVVLAGFGVVAWAIGVTGFWQTLGVILLGTPVVLFLASWPIAIGQLMRAVSDIGDAVDVKNPDRSGIGTP